MANEITYEKFKTAITTHTEILRREYLKLIEKAADKEYASLYYQRILFQENELVPYSSVLFHELTYTFNHYRQLLGIKEAFSKTIESLPQIKAIANKAILNAKRYKNSKNTGLLSNWYLLQIEENELDLAYLIWLEEKVLESTVEELFGALSLHLSGLSLYKEFNQPINEPEIESSLSTKGQFSLNERVLALSILLESLGFRQGINEDRTALAKIYHLIINKGYNDKTIIKNTNIYKSLGKLSKIVNDSQKRKIYLQNIRPLFEQVNMSKALEIIDERIRLESPFD